MSREFRLKVSDATAQRLEDIAARKGVEVGELFRCAISQYVMIDKLADAGALVIDTDTLPPTD